MDKEKLSNKDMEQMEQMEQMEHLNRWEMECRARVLALEIRRDRILEMLEDITAKIYSEVKRLEIFGKGIEYREDGEIESTESEENFA